MNRLSKNICRPRYGDLQLTLSNRVKSIIDRFEVLLFLLFKQDLPAEKHGARVIIEASSANCRSVICFQVARRIRMFDVR